MAIILKFSKNNKKIFGSMRFALLLILIGVGILPVAIFNVVYVKAQETRMIDDRINMLKNQCNMIKNSIISHGDLDNLDVKALSLEISQISSLYDRRVVIIDKSHKIIDDSFFIDKDKYCVSEAVVKAFDGEDSFNYDEENDNVEFILGMSNRNSYDIRVVLYVSYSVADIEATIAEIRNIGSMIVVLFSVLVVIGAIIVSRRFTKPLGRIEDAIEVATTGRFDEKIEVGGFSETANIANAFNELLGKIDEYEESRQEFVSNVSHELRTPITSIKVLADSLLSQGDVPNELYREFMEDIANEIDRENDIISDLLTLVKMDKSNDQLNIESVSVNDSIELILKRVRPLAAKKNIEVVYESVRPVNAEIDNNKFIMAITNLVENAVKYNVEDGWVRLTLNADTRFFYVEVEDSGIGINEEEYDKIFERFYRIDKTRSRETGGTGLGLAITKGIVLMHKGSISVSSGEETGTKFVVKIPINFAS